MTEQNKKTSSSDLVPSTLQVNELPEYALGTTNPLPRAIAGLVLQGQQRDAAHENEMADLRRTAEIDELTGLYRKEVFGKKVNSRLERLPKGKTAALVLIDLDDFEKFEH